MRKIKGVVWDVDGTLYRSTPEIEHIYKEIYTKFLEEYLPNKSISEAFYLFEKHKREYKSSTKALSKVTNLSIIEVTQFLEKYLKKQRRLQQDSRLTKTFQNLPHLRHLALRNGGREETLHILKMLGLENVRYPYPTELGPFIKVWGSVDDFSALKPDYSIFKDIEMQLEKYVQNLRDNSEVLFVGDRVEVELKPAKRLGFTTCLIGNNSPLLSPYIDLRFTTVYSLGDYLKRV